MAVLERILAGVDFSDSSRAALRQAAAFAAAASSELHIAHVIDLPPEDPVAAAYHATVEPDEAVRAALQKSEQMMQAALADADISAAGVQTVHLRGPRPADALLEYANRIRADLVVVGTHGRRGLKKLLLGSVAMALAAESELPVLIARRRTNREPGRPVDRILVPIDLSDHSTRALQAAKRIAVLVHARLEILHVLEPYSIPISLSKIKTIRELLPDVEPRVHEMVQHRVEALEGPYIPNRIHVREGEPTTVITDFAQESGCDLIVMSRRGLSPGERFLLGSVTQKVLQAAHCSVFVQPIAR